MKITKMTSLILAFAVFVCILGGCAEKPKTVAELMSLGEKYLIELDYENSVVQFLKVIEIEPMNPRAYLAAAEAYVGLGQTDNAAAILKRGLEALPDNEEIRGMLETLNPEPEPEFEQQDADHPEQISADVQEYMEALYALCETGDNDRIWETIDADEFREIAELTNESEPLFYSPYSEATNKSGKGLGIYGKHIYFGDYAENERNGNGIWMRGFNHYIFEGSWSGDKPNGYGEERVERIGSVEVQTGNLLNGLWNGDVQLSYLYPDGKVRTYSSHYTEGTVTILGEMVDDGGETMYFIAENDEGGNIAHDERKVRSPYGIQSFTD